MLMRRTCKQPLSCTVSHGHDGRHVLAEERMGGAQVRSDTSHLLYMLVLLMELLALYPCSLSHSYRYLSPAPSLLLSMLARGMDVAMLRSDWSTIRSAA